MQNTKPLNILFINGLLCTQEAWGDLNRLRQTHPSLDANIVDFDSMDAMTKATEKLANPKKEYCVIGFSMGGYVALSLALRHPPWLKKLVLINTTAEALDERSRGSREAGLKAARKGDLDAVIKGGENICFNTPTAPLEELRKKMAYEVGTQCYINQQTAIMGRSGCMNELSQIAVPTLIISTHEDRIIPVTDSIQMQENIPNSKLIILNSCGHFSPLEKSKEAAQAVTDFLE